MRARAKTQDGRYACYEMELSDLDDPAGCAMMLQAHQLIHPMPLTDKNRADAIQNFRKQLSGEDMAIFLLWDQADKQVVGNMLIGTPGPAHDGMADAHYIYVKQNLRGRGLASCLGAGGFESLRQKGYHGVRGNIADTNTASIRAALQNGLTRTKTVISDDDPDDPVTIGVYEIRFSAPSPIPIKDL